MKARLLIGAVSLGVEAKRDGFGQIVLTFRARLGLLPDPP